jgi:hypothetical protein
MSVSRMTGVGAAFAGFGSSAEALAPSASKHKPSTKARKQRSRRSGFMMRRFVMRRNMEHALANFKS